MQGIWHAFRRRIRRLRYRRRPRAAFLYDAAGGTALPGVPLDPLRARKILAFLAEEGAISDSDVTASRTASMANIRRAHSDRYLDSLGSTATLEGVFGTPVPEAEVPDLLATHRRMVGGTIQATRLALGTGRVGVNLGGGFHHAAPDRGMGFCIFNDMAVAILRLRAHGYSDPVLVVDLDLHDGNGTRVTFADDPTVYTFSIHNATWDDAPAVASTTVALGTGVDDETYLSCLRNELPPVVRRHAPGLVIFLAGTDPAFDDALGDWRITPEGMLARDQLVMSELRLRVPDAAVAVVLGGGYGTKSWRYTARFLAWVLTDRVTEPYGASDRVFEQVGRMGQVLADPQLTRDSPGDDDWSLSASDLPGFDASAGPVRVLGRYSPYGMELILERTGILEDLRHRGFLHPRVEVTADQGPISTVRVFGDRDKTQLLVELRVGINRRVVPGEDVLYVEWLLLQNPTATFTEDRPPLPGQDHPGLGLLGPVAGLLVGMAQALHLAGVAFTPANYYMAALGQHHLRFLDPVDQARFEALVSALSGLSMAQASRALEQGRLRDAATGETVSWRPGPMVIPAGPALKRLVSSSDYQARLRAARGRFRFRLMPPAADAHGARNSSEGTPNE